MPITQLNQGDQNLLIVRLEKTLEMFGQYHLPMQDPTAQAIGRILVETHSLLSKLDPSNPVLREE